MQRMKSKNFYDRFWITDRSRGVIMRTSLYKIDRKFFFTDALSDSDVAAVLREADTPVGF